MKNRLVHVLKGSFEKVTSFHRDCGSDLGRRRNSVECKINLRPQKSYSGGERNAKGYLCKVFLEKSTASPRWEKVFQNKQVASLLGEKTLQGRCKVTSQV